MKIIMFTYTEHTLDNLSQFDIYTEAENPSHIICDELYPIVEKVLLTEEGKRKFSRIVSEYVNKNITRLSTIGPQYLVPFTYADKDAYYDLFNITEHQISEVINKTLSNINDKASWLLIKKNPIFVLLYLIIRYFTINRDAKLLNNALVITALAFYPSMFTKYFKFEPNAGVMHYTIDNLPRRFIIKKSSHIFGTLTYSIQNSWRFHEQGFIRGYDIECIRFIQRIRNDQNSLIKKIANNYHENYKKGLTVTTAVDSYDDSVVVDNENNSNKVESIVNKVVLKLLINGINLKFCDFAANAANVSKIELRNYLTKIIIEKNSNDMKSFIENILFIYLYDQKHDFTDINSKEFVSFALALFKKTNSKDENITSMKKMLDKWGTDSGIYGKFNRLGTRIDYSRGIFLYFIMSIQQYNN